MDRDTSTAMDVDEDKYEGKVNAANALNLSDSEEEEEMEDIIDDFSRGMRMEEVRTLSFYAFLLCLTLL